MWKKLIVLIFFLIPFEVHAEFCDLNTLGYFSTSGEAFMMEDQFVFGFNGIANKKLFIKRICFETEEQNVTYSFISDQEVFFCNSSDCCKTVDIELPNNHGINIKANKETGMKWAIEGCYLE